MDDSKSPVQIVAIGASAGGMTALSEFFRTMPGDSGMAFVVIQHLDPNHESHMASLLAKITPMQVVQAEHRAPVQANCVYTIPPGKFLAVEGGMLQLSEPVKSDGIRLPIDFFLRSLAGDQHEKSIAVLLSGSGSDGTIGIREVSAAGGIVIAQDPKSAQFDSMIESAISTGRVDSVLPVREMAGALLEYVRQLPSAFSETESAATSEYLGLIVDLLARRTHNDFHHYKNATLQRRLARRMGLNRIGQVADYYQLLEGNPEEIKKLAKDMLISVTSFFRDPEAFTELGAKVIGPLIQENLADRPLRIWCAGCATGEEVYSLAMLIMEEMVRGRKKFPVQIFASDIDSDALKIAREGIFPESIAADVTAERLARFFTKKEHEYQIDKAIREVVTFARHNVITDPPFMKMDLISCRNVLIYIDGEMQNKILNLFAFALNPGGYLFLGKSETCGEQSDSFDQISRGMRIFRRKRSVAVQVANFPVRAGVPIMPFSRMERLSPIGLSELNQQVLLRHFNASIVLVDEHGNILHFYGSSQKYLAHPFGDANLNLYDMVGQRNSSALRLAVRKAVDEDGTVNLGPLEFSRDDDSYRVAITVTPIMELKSRRKLSAIIFEEVARAAKDSPNASQTTARDGHGNDLVQQLESEISRIKDELQLNIDSFQTTHQELTAANEEILAINEELQSTNEELETSKEEMQSVNEELITVNNQLTAKVEELSRTTDDLANFLNSSEVGTIFLDNEICIRRFTPSMAKLVNVISKDVGRPISDISTNLQNVDLTSVAANVLKELMPIEGEVQAVDGRWYMMRCLPYRTLSNVIDGTVFTFTDVTSLKHSEAALFEAKNYAENILHSTSVALLVLDPELRVVSANRAFYETFQVTAAETDNRIIFEIGDRQWDSPKLRKLLGDLIRENLPFYEFEVEDDFPRIGPRCMLLNAKRIRDDLSQDRRWLLLTVNDVTARRRAERELRLSGERLLQVFEGAPTAMLLAGADGRITRVNARVEKLFGYARSELVGQLVEKLVPERFHVQHTADRASFFTGPQPRAMGEGRDLYGLCKDGSEVPIEIGLSPMTSPEGVQVMASIIDITERKRTEDALRRAKDQLMDTNEQLEIRVQARTEELEQANRELMHDLETRKRLEEQLRQSQKLESVGTLAAGIAHDFNNILNIISGFASVLRPHGAKNREIGESLEIIDAQVMRGAALAQQLLTIGRKTEGHLAATDINALLSQLARMLQETFPKIVETKLEARPKIPAVVVDSNQISQAVLNLCLNARDAMPNGGRLTIKSDLVDAHSLPDGFEPIAHQYVSIEIIDTGTGIDERMREHLFEPFMTTKKIGQGSGLGLAVAYGIVQSHNGFIRVESKPMQGSSFQILLPVPS